MNQKFKIKYYVWKEDLGDTPKISYKLIIKKSQNINI